MLDKNNNSTTDFSEDLKGCVTFESDNSAQTNDSSEHQSTHSDDDAPPSRD
ncbi:hypothetical protein [Proteus mirabilis]|uniref:hypothetical protein n=1 Tax=Proteus mirabilis TaxID=584 RepID=UPI003D089724